MDEFPRWTGGTDTLPTLLLLLEGCVLGRGGWLSIPPPVLLPGCCNLGGRDWAASWLLVEDNFDKWLVGLGCGPVGEHFLSGLNADEAFLSDGDS